MKTRYSVPSKFLAIILSITLVISMSMISPAFASESADSSTVEKVQLDDVEVMASETSADDFNYTLFSFAVRIDGYKGSSPDVVVPKTIEGRNVTAVSLAGNETIKTLDVSRCAFLTFLDCRDTNISSLDVAALTNLDTLICSNTNLSELDISSNAQLRTLECQRTNISTLDISRNSALSSLLCYETKLTSLDISSNAQLRVLYCQNCLIVDTDALEVWEAREDTAGQVLPQKVIGRRITATADKGGSISPSGSFKVVDGVSQTFTFSADAGYEFDAVWVNEKKINSSKTTYTLSNVTEDYSVRVSFKKTVTPKPPDPTDPNPIDPDKPKPPIVLKYTITKNYVGGDNGTVTVIAGADGSPATLYPTAGATVTFRTSPKIGYTLTRMSYTTASGKTVALKRVSGTGRAGTNSVYSFKMPKENVKLNATFSVNTMKINKKITGSGQLMIVANKDGSKGTLFPQVGKMVTFKAIPATGYKLSKINYIPDLTGKPIALTKVPGTSATYTIIMPNSNVTLNGVFVKR